MRFTVFTASYLLPPFIVGTHNVPTLHTKHPCRIAATGMGICWWVWSLIRDARPHACSIETQKVSIIICYIDVFGLGTSGSGREFFAGIALCHEAPEPYTVPKSGSKPGEIPTTALDVAADVRTQGTAGTQSPDRITPRNPCIRANRVQVALILPRIVCSSCLDFLAFLFSLRVIVGFFLASLLL